MVGETRLEKRECRAVPYPKFYPWAPTAPPSLWQVTGPAQRKRGPGRLGLAARAGWAEHGPRLPPAGQDRPRRKEGENGRWGPQVPSCWGPPPMLCLLVLLLPALHLLGTPRAKYSHVLALIPHSTALSCGVEGQMGRLRSQESLCGARTEL